MKNKENNTILPPISGSSNILFGIMENIEEVRRIMAKANSMSFVLYEAILSMQDFPARVGDKVLSDATEIICDYGRQADEAIKELYEQIDALHTKKYELCRTDN